MNNRDIEVLNGGGIIDYTRKNGERLLLIINKVNAYVGIYFNGVSLFDSSNVYTIGAVLSNFRVNVGDSWELFTGQIDLSNVPKS